MTPEPWRWRMPRRAWGERTLGCHVLVVDLFPPGPHDPRGINEAIWEEFGEASEGPASPSERVLASYLARTMMPEAYLREVALGEAPPKMPLFLDIDSYVPLPRDGTYGQAYRGMPAYWRGVVEGE